MKLLYPRCCVLEVQQQVVVACLRLQDVDGPAHKEVRTFGPMPSDVVVLSDWLAGHGVTHVAIEHRAGAWEPLYRGLQQAFTVLLINAADVTDGKDIQWIADLLAYGLVQGQAITPSALQQAPRTSRRARLAVVAVLFLALLTSYGVWRVGSRVDPEPPPGPPPPGSVRWQPLQVAYQHPAGEPFKFPLPTLERPPEGIPVAVMLETPGASPSWLQLDHDGLHIRGTAPIMAADQTYQLIVLAQAEDGSESRLRVYLTIMGQRQLPPSATDPRSPPTPLTAVTVPDRPPDAAHAVKISQEASSPASISTEPFTPSSARAPQPRPADQDCLLKTLSGEPCARK
jgi:hypothetical protein